MSRSMTITLTVPHAEKESVFLYRAIQAAISAYRNNQKENDDENTDPDKDGRGGHNIKVAA